MHCRDVDHVTGNGTVAESGHERRSHCGAVTR
jgi:hypothetical protein